MQEARREIWFLLESDQVVTGIHPQALCSGTCVVHKPSKHWMREFPLHFDLSTKAFVRLCKHDAFHQDPDERTYWTTQLSKSITSKRSPGARKLESLAMQKLSDWACPLCGCGCCDVTTKTTT